MISTSDGLVFNSEHEFESHLFTKMAMNTQGMQSSNNIEDDRTQADKWGDSFGPSEGGPPAGIDPNTWYNDSLLQHGDEGSRASMAKKLQEISDKFGRTSDPSVLNSAEDVQGIPPDLQSDENSAEGELPVPKQML